MFVPPFSCALQKTKTLWGHSVLSAPMLDVPLSGMPAKPVWLVPAIRLNLLLMALC
jgi:hypothetical protein